MASIKEHQKATAFVKVMVVAHDTNRRLFEGQGSIGALMESESVAPHQPCAELSVSIEADGGHVVVGMVLDGPDAEFAPVSVMSIINGHMPMVSAVQVPA